MTKKKAEPITLENLCYWVVVPLASVNAKDMYTYADAVQFMDYEKAVKKAEERAASGSASVLLAPVDICRPQCAWDTEAG